MASSQSVQPSFVKSSTTGADAPRASQTAPLTEKRATRGAARGRRSAAAAKPRAGRSAQSESREKRIMLSLRHCSLSVNMKSKLPARGRPQKPSAARAQATMVASSGIVPSVEPSSTPPLWRNARLASSVLSGHLRNAEPLVV